MARSPRKPRSAAQADAAPVLPPLDSYAFDVVLGHCEERSRQLLARMRDSAEGSPEFRESLEKRCALIEEVCRQMAFAAKYAPSFDALCPLVDDSPSLPMRSANRGRDRTQ